MKLRLAMLVVRMLILTVVLAPSMFSQSSGAGAIAGTIYDSAGAVVPNAPVTLVNLATNVSSQAITTAAGRYNFPQLNPGVYKLSVVVAGFKESVQTGVTVSVGAIVTQDITLQVGESSQSVVVTADAQQI